MRELGIAIRFIVVYNSGCFAQNVKDNNPECDLRAPLP
jgi:hypothetical protein